MRLDEIIQQHTKKLSPQLQAEAFDFVLFLEKKQANKSLVTEQQHWQDLDSTDIIRKTAGILSSQNIDPLKWQSEIRDEWEDRM